MKIGIIGCGLIGQKRAAAIGKNDQLVAVTDVVGERAQSLAKAHGARAASSAQELVRDPSIEAVIVATTHNQLASNALLALEQGKHVLLEKPGARRPAELDALRRLAQAKQLTVHVGFNHRFHPALRKARALVDAGEIGPLYYIRGRYGHGGRIGYDREWRATPEISGGGELLDQGAHLIDLTNWFFAEPFEKVHGLIATYFWDMPVEDNAFLTLQTGTGKIAQLQVTWTEWKNLFSFEIVGRDGKLQVEGLGGSYGVESLRFYKMKPEMGPPETTIWEYPGADKSWHDEWKHFQSEVEQRQVEAQPGLASTAEVLGVVERVYLQSKVSWLESTDKGAGQ